MHRIAGLGLAILLAAPIATLTAAPALAGQIQGRVTNAQGGAVAGATVSIASPQGEPKGQATTGADGSYSVPGLNPGAYTVSVSASPAGAAAASTLSRQVAIADGVEPVRADFQFQAAAPAAASTSIAAEERNPNIFVYKIDLNDLRNRLTVGRGPDPTYIPQFTSDLNYFGAEFGAPLFSYEVLRPRSLVRAWRSSLYALHQNSKLNARNFFNVGPLLASRSTTYSMTANGPLFSDRAGLLLQYGQTLTSGAVNGNVQSPKDNQRVPTTTDPLKREFIARLLKAYPAESPNLGETRLNSNAPRSIDSKDALARVDYKWSELTNVAVRYSVSDYSEDPFQIIIGQNPQTDVRTQAAYLGVTHNFSPNTTSRFAFNYDRTGAALLPTKKFLDLFKGLNLDKVPDIDFASDEFTDLGPLPQFPRRRYQNRYQTYADVVHSAGMHTWKAGWSSTRVQLNDLQSDNSRGIFRFQRGRGCTPETQNIELSEIDNLLLGCPSRYVLAIGTFYRGFRNWEHFGYLEDQMKLTPTLTVTAGVRYELMTAPVEVNNLTDVGYQADKNNFAPRFGFAWNPGKSKTVIRGGYGISYAQIMGVTYGMTRFNAPQVQVFQRDNPDLLNPVVPSGPQTTYSLSPNLMPAYSHHYTLGIERAIPWGLTVRAAYVGSRTFHLLMQQTYNRAQPSTVLPNTTATIQARRPDQRYADVIVIESNANAYYDALVVSADKRLSNGLTFRTTYGYGKNIDTGGDFTNTATGVEKPPEIGTSSCEICDYVSDHKGVSLFDTPHAFAISYSYTLPSAGITNRIAKTLFSGWQVSGTTSLQSGTPYHIHTGGDGPGLGNVDGWGQDRPNLKDPRVIGKSYDDPDTSPILLGAIKTGSDGKPLLDAGGNFVPACTRVPAGYFDCPYFDTNVPVGGRGNIGLNVFRKDGTHNWNFAFGRTFPVPGGRERTLQFRSEFINLFNHAQFDKANVQLSSAIFGQLTNTANKGRQVQFSLRLNF